MKAKFIIGSVIVVIFGIWGVSAFLKTTVKYVPFAEAAAAERTVQITGAIDFNSVRYDADQKRLTFSIVETDSDNPQSPDSMKIIYYGVIPGNFDQATSVMVRGKPSDEGFIAEKLYVKCPSKYQGLSDGSR